MTLHIRKTCVSSFDHTATRTQEFMHYESIWASPEAAAGIRLMQLTINQQLRAAPQRVAEPVQERSRSPPLLQHGERTRKWCCARCLHSRAVVFGRHRARRMPESQARLTQRARGAEAVGRPQRLSSRPNVRKEAFWRQVSGVRNCDAFGLHSFFSQQSAQTTLGTCATRTAQESHVQY